MNLKGPLKVSMFPLDITQGFSFYSCMFGLLESRRSHALFKLKICILCVMSILPICMCLTYPKRPEGGIGSAGTGAMVSFKLACGCWEPRPVPQQEQQVLLTAQPSCQSPHAHFPTFPQTVL